MHELLMLSDHGMQSLIKSYTRLFNLVYCRVLWIATRVGVPKVHTAANYWRVKCTG